MAEFNSDFGSLKDDYISPITQDKIELIEWEKARCGVENYPHQEAKFHPDDPSSLYRNGQVNKGFADEERGTYTALGKKKDEHLYNSLDQQQEKGHYNALTSVRDPHLYNRLERYPFGPDNNLEKRLPRDSFHGNGAQKYNNGVYEEPPTDPFSAYEVLPPIPAAPPPYSPPVPIQRGVACDDREDGVYDKPFDGGEYITTLSTERPGTPVKQSRSPNWKLSLYIFCGVFVAGLLLLAIILGLVFGLKPDNDGSGTTTTSVSPTTTTSFVSSTGIASSTGTVHPSTAPPDGWSQWTSWSECSLSCSGGQQTRSRTCPTSQQCHGTGSQARSCQKQKCPGPNYGKWATWQSWIDCSTSCGSGTQTRTRECKQSEGQEPCPGEVDQQRSCNDWECPSCDDNSVCPIGCTLDSTHCRTCINETGGIFTGKVTSQHLVPLKGVAISEQRLPNHILATTNETGHFTIEQGCEGAILLLQMNQREDATYELKFGMESMQMNSISLITISQHPASNKVRLVGETVILCCTAVGIPPPEYYEWFKDDILVSSDFYTNGQEFVLNNVQLEDSGYYKCRANNKYTAVFSEESHLQIKDKPIDFCSVQPSANVIPLPEGCIYQGSNTFDRGTCNASPCRHESERNNGTCGSVESEYCCGPVDIDYINIDCSDGTKLPMLLITRCDCIKCLSIPFIIIGRLINSDGLPLPYKSIYVNDTKTNEYSDSRGEFLIKITKETPIMVITIRDEFDDLYYETTKIVYLKGQKRIIYKTIRMVRKPEAIDVSASEPQPIVLGGDNPFGAIIVPPNALYNNDGTLYQGIAKATVGALNPKNASDMLAAPSNLISISAEGTRTRLISRGMFSLQFTDNSGSTLVLGKPVQIIVNANILPKSYSDGLDNFLWSLNQQSGVWEPRGHVQNVNASVFDFPLPFTTIAVGEMEIYINETWHNFDQIRIEEEVCYIKIRIYESDNFDTPLTRDVDPAVIIMNPNQSTEQGDLSVLTAYSDTPGTTGEYCLASQCHKQEGGVGYYGYIFVDDGGDSFSPRLSPANKSNSGMSDTAAEQLNYEVIGSSDNNPALKLDMDISAIPPDQAGPLYDTDPNRIEETPCSYVNDSQNHVRFYKKAIENCSYEITTQEEVSGKGHHNYVAFYAGTVIGEYDTCYVKLMVNNGIMEKFRVTSFVGNTTVDNETHVIIEPGVTQYGLREECPLSQASSVCLEIKRSGMVSDGSPPFMEDMTLVQIERLPSHKTCKYEIKDDFENIYGHRIIEKGERFVFYKDDHLFGKLFGIYCAYDEDNIESAKNNAFNQCAEGGHDVHYSRVDARFVNNEYPLLIYDCE